MSVPQHEQFRERSLSHWLLRFLDLSTLDIGGLYDFHPYRVSVTPPLWH